MESCVEEPEPESGAGKNPKNGSQKPRAGPFLESRAGEKGTGSPTLLESVVTFDINLAHIYHRFKLSTKIVI